MDKLTSGRTDKLTRWILNNKIAENFGVLFIFGIFAAETTKNEWIYEEYSFSATHSAIIVAIAIAIFPGNATMLTSMHPSHNWRIIAVIM